MLKKLLRTFHRFEASRNNRFELPHYPEMKDYVPNTSCLPSSGETAWYTPIMIGARGISSILGSASTIVAARDLLERLTPDDYSRYLISYYDTGINRFGDYWGFSDIVTVVMTLAKVLNPRRYLEIGVRSGRTACAVASITPDCNLTLFDMWIQDYAGMPNPGPDFVRSELARVGHRGSCQFIDGDSHETLPVYFQRNPRISFDLITVDGDHTDEGAAQDLHDVLPKLAIGGAVVFDDICHPSHPGLREVWNRSVCRDKRFSSCTYDDAGYGVGFAIRKW